MKLITDIRKLRRKLPKPVLTLGIFDGVHLAHQRIIKEVVRCAQESQGTSIVLTFNPHPLKVLKADSAVPLICSIRHRIDLIQKMNVDACVVLDFTKNFARTTAQDFLKDVLVETLKIKLLIVGEDFRFGAKKSGSLPLLKKLSDQYSFKLKCIAAIKFGGRINSSSRIRRLIQKGKIRQANILLGRKFSIFGRVKKGRAQGRLLGYPTANIKPEQEVVPSPGVYAVLAKIDEQTLAGIANIGFRPTFYPRKRAGQTIEVHIFNFYQKIYGKRIEIIFVQRIRPEKRFVSSQSLLQQIKKDEQKAKGTLREIHCLP